MSLVADLRQTLARLCGEHARIVLGVSGGADSVALLRGLREAGWNDRVIAAHLNHRLRGQEAEDDARWVQALCQRLSVPAEIGECDVAARAAQTNTGIEEAARSARYHFFSDVARRRAAPFVAVAHTADDQAETVLHHVLRGTGLAGLGGMPESRPLSDGLTLIRPVLTLSRTVLRTYLASIGQDFREDSSNASRDHTRNRLRQELLPLLARDYNPQIVERLLSLSQLAREAQEVLAHRARQLMQACLRDRDSESVQLEVESLRSEPRHLVRELFVEIWKSQDWPRQPMTARHWTGLAAVALGETVAMTLPGRIDARRRRGVLTIREVSTEQTRAEIAEE